MSSALLGQGPHLVVLSHGMWGRRANVQELATALAVDATVLIIGTNELLRTYDGVEVCGARLAAEIKRVIGEQVKEQQQQPFDRISFVGYSAGGLFVRYAAGLLHSEGFFASAGLKPLLLLTFATPHLGIRHAPRSTAGRAYSAAQAALSNLYGGRALQQMVLADDDGEGGIPILEALADPSLRYHEALLTFQRVVFYANARNDFSVPYWTASGGMGMDKNKNPYADLPPPPPIAGHEYVVYSGPFDGLAPHVEEAETAAAAGEEEAEARKSMAGGAKAAAGQAAAALLLVPLVLVQIALLILPLRVASYATRDDAAAAASAARWRRASNATNGSGTGSCTRGSSGSPSDSDGDDVNGSGHGSRGSSAKMRQNHEAVTARIRENLRLVPNLQRVDVHLPGKHTHGVIIVRKSAPQGAGHDVIRHALGIMRSVSCAAADPTSPVSETGASGLQEGNTAAAAAACAAARSLNEVPMAVAVAAS